MSGALDGLVALDLATYVAAPFCCTLLGELGADVIKVEQPGLGDDLRRLGHKAADGISYMWLVEGRNKESITCNLREPEGQALIARLPPAPTSSPRTSGRGPWRSGTSDTTRCPR